MEEPTSWVRPEAKPQPYTMITGYETEGNIPVCIVIPSTYLTYTSFNTRFIPSIFTREKSGLNLIPRVLDGYESCEKENPIPGPVWYVQKLIPVQHGYVQ